MGQAQFDTSVLVATSALGGQLLDLLMADDIVPGSDTSYQLCKAIYIYHPLGKKMADSPIATAQSRPRKRVVQGAPNEVMEEFERVWSVMRGDDQVLNVHSLARIYGISSLVLGCEGDDPSQPLDLSRLVGKSVFFNALDPLNTAGSLVLSQIPTSAAFNKPVTVETNGVTYHPTRFVVVMNEMPVYLAYTNSAFGFVGRSVYQRALFPLKSYIRSMIADDMVLTKLGLLVAKQKKPGSVIDNVMATIAGIKRGLLKEAQTGQVLSIDTEEDIETLNMMNVDGAGTYARGNCLKNVATAADMPAKMLENETMVSGFGEGVEDAKNNARYVDGIRKTLEPTYNFIEPVCMHLAWTPEFYSRIQRLYPEAFGDIEYADAFSEWRHNFHAEWESWLIEPESEAVKVEQIKNESTIALLQTLLPELDPDNRAIAIQWALDNVTENKRLFPHELDINFEDLAPYLEEQDERRAAMGEGGDDDDGKPQKGLANKAGKFSG